MVPAIEKQFGSMIQNFLASQLQFSCLTDIWYQQDAATSHTGRITMKLLRGGGDWSPCNWLRKSKKQILYKLTRNASTTQNIRDEINA